MPQTAFFRSLGLFVEDNFVVPAVCTRIKEQMCASACRKGVVVGAGGEEEAETERRVLCARIDASAVRCVRDCLLELKPRLEAHFRVSLSSFETPAFLRYSQGAYYKTHVDVSSDMPADYLKRRISVVVFLNAQGQENEPDSYGGGALTFYGLMKGPKWENFGFPLEPSPGLLVAFPSDIAHEVQPVAFGERFTVVTWFND